MSESHSPGIDDPMEFIHRGTHMSHCHQGQYVGVCKYGYRHCPAKPAIPLMTCEGCGINLESGEGKRWADDVITCLKCSPGADELRTPEDAEDWWATLAMDCGVSPFPEDRAEFVKVMRQVVEQASGLGDGAGWVSVPGHILAMAERMRTQDNRATSHPVYCVQKMERTEGTDDAYGDEYTWRDDEWNEAGPEKTALLDVAEEDDDSAALRGWTKMYHCDRWETVMTCLTEKGAADYIAAKAHHLSTHCPPRIYVASMYACSEMIDLREWLLSLPSPPAAGG